MATHVTNQLVLKLMDSKVKVTEDDSKNAFLN